MDKREYVLECAEKGYSIPKIAKKTGLKESTVYSYIHSRKLNERKAREKKAVKEVITGWNTSRKGCRKCRFRANIHLKNMGVGCNYIEHTGHSRGCKVEDCTVYEAG